MHHTITPAMLPNALEGREQTQVLSLDCFDTLLWRDVHAPVHVFSTFTHCTLQQRVHAEGRARDLATKRLGRSEVAIEEIYAELMPNARDAERAEAIAAELDAEARHCFAFAPTVALMREAKARGLQVVIVSDTYLSAAQLGELIARAAGEEVASLIDRIFASSEIGQSKAGGMFGPVLRKLKAEPQALLHIGDNPHADIEGAAAHDIPALHLLQFDPATHKRLRLEASIAAMIREGRATTPAGAQPHRAALALVEPACEDAAKLLGATTLGPVFHAYEMWLQAEAEALARTHGGRVHWLFLMRDGHLPREVHHAVGSDTAISHPVEISRFTATAASLAAPGAIQRHCEEELGLNPATLARQMLLSEAEIEQLVDDDPQASSQRLSDHVRQGHTQKHLRRRARGFAQRLVAHVRYHADPQPGDVVMLVDLGYNGSVQNKIDALLREELGVHVAGRYLLMREQDCPGLDKAGLISSATHDPQVLEAMCANVAVLEQLCTAPMGSVMDYEVDGAPIRRATGIKGRQSDIREAVQDGCLAYVREASGEPIIREGAGDQLALWRDAASAALMRLMFLPLPDELAVIADFEHDVNLGSERTVPLFDIETATAGMRERGLFYMKGSQRMYLPAELALHDLSVRLSLFAQRRFGLDFSMADFAEKRIAIPARFARDGEVTRSVVQARPTSDGYFCAAIPLGANRFSVALQLGAEHEIVELAKVEAMPVHAFGAGEAADRSRHVALTPVLDGLDEIAPNLLRCESAQAALVIDPPPGPASEAMLVAVTFRPLAPRLARTDADTPHLSLAGVA